MVTLIILYGRARIITKHKRMLQRKVRTAKNATSIVKTFEIFFVRDFVANIARKIKINTAQFPNTVSSDKKRI